MIVHLIKFGIGFIFCIIVTECIGLAMAYPFRAFVGFAVVVIIGLSYALGSTIYIMFKPESTL